MTVRLYCAPILKDSIPRMEKLGDRALSTAKPRKPTTAMLKPICMREARRRNRRKIPRIPIVTGLMIPSPLPWP